MDLCGSLLLVGVCLTAISAADEGLIEVMPKGLELSKPKGDNFGLTCNAFGANLDLLTNFRWLDPKNMTIDENYTKLNNRFSLQTSRGQLLLLINKVSENDVGVYTCLGEYNQKLLAVTRNLKVYSPIKWLDANTEQSAELGSTYKIMCKVEANPSPTVSWSKNGIKLTNQDRFAFDSDGLTITDVKESDDGSYVCEVVVAETGEYKTMTINFEVISKPKVLAVVASSSDAIEGDDVKISCSTSGKPKPNITWIFGRDNSLLSSGADGILYISKVSKKDGGQYKCAAVNKAGRDEKFTTLNIVSMPEIVEYVNAIISNGESGKLMCYVEGYPTPTVIIRKQGQALQNIETNELTRQTVIKEDPKKRPNTILATLNFEHVQRSMDGLYECVATNKVGNKHVETIKNLHLTVQFKPTFEKTGFVKEQVTWAQRPVNLTCVAESIPNASIQWYFGSNAYPITSANMYQVHGVGPRSDLEVRPLTKDVYGTYKCKATNLLGEAYHQINLKEAFPPNPISNVDASDVTASSITFRINDPVFNGGLPIKGYVVQYMKEETGADWNSATEKQWPVGGPYILTDLKPMVKYTFRFRAFNEAGSGQWGGFLSKQMPEISSPSEPVITNPLTLNEKYIKSPQPNQISLQWTIPSSNGADIDKYSVRYCPAQPDQNLQEGFFVSQESCLTQEISYNTFVSSYTIEKLNPNSFYRVELIAHNNLGYSQPSTRFFLTNDIRDERSTGKASSAFELFDVLLFVVSSVTLNVIYYF